MKRKYLNTILLFLLLLNLSISLNIRSGTTSSKVSSSLFEYKKVKVSILEPHTQSTNSQKSILYSYYDQTSTNLKFSFEKLNSQQYLAKGVYEASRFKEGWDKLFIKTNDLANPLIQCWSAGYIEGYLTHEVIYDNYENSKRMFKDNLKEIDDIKALYSEVHEEMGKLLTYEFFKKLNKSELKKYALAACIKAQLEGITIGYNKIAIVKLSIEDFYYMNTQGNFGDIKRFLKMRNTNKSKKENFFTEENLKKEYNTTNIDQIWKKLLLSGHCSAILKLLNNNGKLDVLVGHNTWTDYSELLRMMKVYNFAFEGDNLVLGLERTKLVFSSYPASIYSGDDFYVTSNNLVITQSTLSPINTFIYQDVIDVKQYVPDFFRIMISNYIAKSGEEWYKVYKSFPMRLYSTQWVVVDYNVLNKINSTGDRSIDKLLIIIEEIPSIILAADLSKLLLQYGYFGSFNLPYFKETQNKSGISHYRSQNLNLFSEDYNPRFQILGHFQKDVKNIEDFKHLMQYNGYKLKNSYFKNDPSSDDPSNGISSRGDLLSPPVFSGGIDYKIVNADMVKKMEIITKSGPTSDKNPNLKIFSFKDFKDPEMANYHLGMPESFNFRSILFSELNDD